MKKTHLLIALAMIAALPMVSCKNNNKKAQEPTAEEIQAKKLALADSVLADIDEFEKIYADATDQSFRILSMELTDAEKSVKPDYLLDPALADTFLTRSQKINALAIYLTDWSVLELYEMPDEDTKNAIAKLAAEINFPVDVDFVTSNEPVSEKIKKIYEACKNSGDLALFWQFEYMIVSEVSYVLSCNPDLYLSRITEEQWQAFNARKKARRDAVNELAKYDEEMAKLVEVRKESKVSSSDEERDAKNQSIQTAKEFYKTHKDKYAAKRNAFLQ